MRFEGRPVDWRVSGAGDGMSVPGNDEEYAAIAGFGNHEGGVAFEEAAVKDEMDALAGDHHWLDGGIGHLADGISQDARRVDDDSGLDAEFMACFGVAGGNTVDVSFIIAQESGDGAVVEERSAVVGGGHGEVDEKAGVIELAIVIDDTAAQLVGLKSGQAPQGFFFGKQA